jgi:hypothetical protein
LRSPITHELAETTPRWVQSLGPIAEHVAHVFGKAMAGTFSAATAHPNRKRGGARGREGAQAVSQDRGDVLDGAAETCQCEGTHALALC